MPEPPRASAERYARACREVDVLIERSIGHYPEALPISHPDRLKPLPTRTTVVVDLPAWSDRVGTPSAGIDRAVRRARTVGEEQARALLVSGYMGDSIVGTVERERLITRAIGILPASDEELFRELLLAPELVPGVVSGPEERAAARAAPLMLLTAVEAITRHYRPATGLAWGMSVLAGNRAPEQMIETASGLDRLCLRVSSSPAVARALESAVDSSDVQRRLYASDSAVSFEERLGVLTAVRNQLWALKPKRVSTPFLLPQVLDCYLGNESGVGNSLGLGLIDAIILGKLGFEVGFMLVNDTVELEVLVAGRVAYWDVMRPVPPVFKATANALRLSLVELFALGWSSLAAVNFNQGRVERAIRNYENVAVVMPRSVETWVNLGHCWLRQRMPERAVASAQRAIEIRPEYAEAHHCLGNAWAMMERWPRAIDAYKRAAAIRPDYVEVYNSLGSAFQRAGLPGQAVAAYEAALEIRPDYAQAHFSLGNVALELERYDDAVRRYREAVRLQPAFAQAWYNMGQACYAKRQLDQALNCYRRAIEIDPKHSGAWHNLGIVYRDKGQREKAVEALERAIALNPNLMR